MKSFIFTVLVTMSAHALAQTATDQNASNQTTAYVGTYSQGDSSSRGVYTISMDGSGLRSQPVLVAVLENASFVAMHPSRPLLYAVSEIGASGPESVGIVAFSIGKGWQADKIE